MCLVSILPKGKEKFNDKVIAFIRKGAASNTQGSGFMYKRNGENKITIDKGYFNVEDLLNKLESLNLTEEDEVVVHHRISTSGLVSEENSHPFVISSKHETVCATNITVNKPCLAHNGMFSDLRDYMSLNPDFSDTYAFARYIMGNPSIMKIYNTDKDLFKLLTKGILSGSRVAILFPDRDLETLGSFVDDDGYKHSNSGYCTYNRNYGGRDHYDPYTYGYYGGHGRHASDDNDNRVTREATARMLALPQGEAKSKYDPTATYFHCKPINKLLELILLDKSTIGTINEYNFEHFYYIDKNDYSRSVDNEDLDVAYIGVFNPNTIFEYSLSLTFKDENGVCCYASESHKQLVNDYYFIPKEEYLDLYKDYVKLINSLKRYPASKTALKNITKKIEENNTKPSNYKVRCSRLGKYAAVQKQALQLFALYLEHDLKKIVTPASTLITSVEENEYARLIGAL